MLGIFGLLLLVSACQSNPEPQNGAYFPPLEGEWETEKPQNVCWNVDALPDLYDYLESTNTRAFIMLKDGKIIVEQYWGRTLDNSADFGPESNWYWASAGKTLIAFLVGQAQSDSILSIQDTTSAYLGVGWTSLAPESEQRITIRNQLSMTTGLNDLVVDPTCTTPNCLQYLTDAGRRWAYHNAPYTLLHEVIEEASQTNFTSYFREKLADKIGMDGQWLSVDNNKVYFSTARAMARFGWLIVNEGVWNGEDLLNDARYFGDMTSSSQNLNLSYGYLWWLNGKNNFMVPGLQTVFNGPLAPRAPSTLIAALGKNGQMLQVIPDMGIVIVRLGDTPDPSQVPLAYLDDLWGYINPVLKR
ncbi:serine hydrolase domain-containing protein [Cytophagales bacterium LB-30]|uniref:Serine hydrolase domain-containing protein n=1 Tax=Shiella aurantiaca TaxID=3058365 RepID=A0ABT8F7N0_9BACT|nr:serine hydrolase domain-containing protein [Shiella aurantiaca]MDN4166465.1 serine hydrolase domain-containing protein [Shiella aurantiaca]